MSVEQLEQSILQLPQEERRRFAEWFYQHENEFVGSRDEISPAIQAEISRRKQEYFDHPERFVEMNEADLDKMFHEINDEVRQKTSSRPR